MNDPRSCLHEGDTAPVDVRDPSTGVIATVARICCDCLAQLPAWWGCPDCETYEVRTLGDFVPDVYLDRPCPRHQEHA